MTTLIAFIFVLSLLIFVHELGHYLVAKLSGIGVEVFSIGMPPRLFGVQIGETEYRISAIPFGGYVKLQGQDDFAYDEDDDEPVGPRDYRGKPAPVKIAVLAAGAGMNVLTAVIIFFFLFWANGIPRESTRVGYVESGSPAHELGLRPGDTIVAVNGGDVGSLDRALLDLYMEKSSTITVERESGSRTFTLARQLDQEEPFGILPYIPATIATVLDDSPAKRAGIEPGDTILSIGGRELDGGWYHMSTVVRAHPDTTLTFTVARNGVEVSLPVHIGTTETSAEDGSTETIGRVGIMPEVPVRTVGPGQAFAQGVRETGFVVTHTLDFFGRLVTGRMSAKMVGGPVMIAQMAGESAESGIATLLSFTAFISINLAVLNMLPFPVLDGGHIFILAVEGISRRKVSTKVRMALQQAGTLVLLLFMLYVTFNDVMRFETIARLFGG